MAQSFDEIKNPIQKPTKGLVDQLLKNTKSRGVKVPGAVKPPTPGKLPSEAMGEDGTGPPTVADFALDLGDKLLNKRARKTKDGKFRVGILNQRMDFDTEEEANKYIKHKEIIDSGEYTHYEQMEDGNYVYGNSVDDVNKKKYTYLDNQAKDKEFLEAKAKEEKVVQISNHYIEQGIHPERAKIIASYHVMDISELQQIKQDIIDKYFNEDYVTGQDEYGDDIKGLDPNISETTRELMKKKLADIQMVLDVLVQQSMSEFNLTPPQQDPPQDPPEQDPPEQDPPIDDSDANQDNNQNPPIINDGDVDSQGDVDLDQDPGHNPSGFDWLGSGSSQFDKVIEDLGWTMEKLENMDLNQKQGIAKVFGLTVEQWEDYIKNYWANKTVETKDNDPFMDLSVEQQDAFNSIDWVQNGQYRDDYLTYILYTQEQGETPLPFNEWKELYGNITPKDVSVDPTRSSQYLAYNWAKDDTINDEEWNEALEIYKKVIMYRKNNWPPDSNISEDQAEMFGWNPDTNQWETPKYVKNSGVLKTDNMYNK